jgi:hypothetical protein
MAAKKSKRLPVRERKPITVYPEPALRDKIEAMSLTENRSLGNQLCEIARQYFAAKEATQG